MSSKIIISMTVKDEDGKEEIVPITYEKSIPGIKEFMVGENFRENFDVLEIAILQGRKEVSEAIVDEILDGASKKKSKRDKRCQILK